MTTMTANIAWLGNEEINFNATTGSNHTITIDSKEVLGARPMELILAGLGSCASYDVVKILQKSRQAITQVECQVSAERATTIPAVFTNIHLHFVIAGQEIKEAQVAKAVALSAEKYCSVGQMLSKGGVSITHDYVIVGV